MYGLLTYPFWRVSMLKRLWKDEAGAIITTELVLVSSIMVCGLVAGLSKVRDAVNGELQGLAQAISSADQSYSVAGTESQGASTAGFGFGGQEEGRIVNNCIMVIGDQ